MPKGGGWKNQSPTPNVNTRYMYFFCNTKREGPVVLELPPAVPGASFYGTIEDAWYVPLVDIGFDGKGGKYLVLPPDYTGDVPAGYIVVRPKTYNTMTLLRSILASLSPDDFRAGNALVQQVKICPLSKAANPPTQRLLDMTDVMYNGLIPYDETFFSSLGASLSISTVAAHSFTTHQTTFSLIPVPQTDPRLLTQRKTRPLVIPAAAVQASTDDLTQFGTGTVRICPPLPIRSTMAQCSSLLCSCPGGSGRRRSPAALWPPWQ